MATGTIKNAEYYQAGDKIKGNYTLYGFTQSNAKTALLYLDTPLKIPSTLTPSATATNVSWLIANTGAMVQQNGSVTGVYINSESQLNLVVTFSNNFSGFYSCVSNVSGLEITFS